MIERAVLRFIQRLRDENLPCELVGPKEHRKFCEAVCRLGRDPEENPIWVVRISPKAWDSAPQKLDMFHAWVKGLALQIHSANCGRTLREPHVHVRKPEGVIEFVGKCEKLDLESIPIRDARSLTHIDILWWKIEPYRVQSA